jgi:glucokinase
MRDFVFLAIGTGIGAGIVLNGQPFRGTSWSAGEIGYMLVPGVPEAPVKRGKPGGLESLIGGEGVRAEWLRLWDKNKTALPKKLTATQIFDGALTGDPLAQSILHQTARLLAYAIRNISVILNCPLFILGGGVGIHPALCDATLLSLKHWSIRTEYQLKRSTLGTDAQLIGALRMALDAAELHQLTHSGIQNNR